MDPKSIKQSLGRLLSLPLEEGKLLVLTHDNPDPDALASAAAMKLLLESKRGIRATIGYSGIIGRAENRAMVRLLDLPIHHLTRLNLDEYRYIALMDAQPHTGNTALPETRPVDIVIDHHPLRDETKKARFYQVSDDLGASATLMTHYLMMAGVEIPTDLATALLYGIRSETQDLGREVHPLDLEAYHHLVPLSDAAKLAAIAKPSLPRQYYAQLAVALDAILVGPTVAICPVGNVTNPDFVPEMADFTVRMEGVRWSLAFGYYDLKMYLSMRSNDPEASAGELMQKVLVEFGKGGGHGMRAGGNVDLSTGSRSRLELERVITERFLNEIGTRGEKLEPLKSEVRSPASARAEE
ncbi:MAG TPA: DHH family phosphoesterase [Thermoanaerobaculia bacterium]|nr:DHH family phosphoesterase [Thermoanaerobaculia bacterium]